MQSKGVGLVGQREGGRVYSQLGEIAGYIRKRRLLLARTRTASSADERSRRWRKPTPPSLSPPAPPSN